MPYQPIPCAQHDQFEIAIMQKQALLIQWHDQHGVHEERVLAKDIQVKNKEEFLLAQRNDGSVLSIRLDRITIIR